MNTLQARTSLPATVPHPPPTVARPALVDRLAMRIGLQLLLWGRHRAQRRTANVHAARLLSAAVRADYDRTVAHASSVPPIR